MKTYILYGQVPEANGREMALMVTVDQGFAHIEAESCARNYPGTRIAETEDESVVEAARQEMAEVSRLEDAADASEAAPISFPVHLGEGEG